MDTLMVKGNYHPEAHMNKTLHNMLINANGISNL